MYRHGKHGKRSVFCFFFSIDLSVRNLFFPQAAEAAASVVNASHFFGTTNSCDVHRNHFVWLQKFFTLVHWLHSFSSKQKYSSSKINLNLKYLNVFFMCQIYVFRCVLPSFFRPEAREDARRERVPPPPPPHPVLVPKWWPFFFPLLFCSGMGFTSGLPVFFSLFPCVSPVQSNFSLLLLSRYEAAAAAATEQGRREEEALLIALTRHRSGWYRSTVQCHTSYITEGGDLRTIH